MTNKFYNLSLRAGGGYFKTRIEATNALHFMIEQTGCNLDASDIEEYTEEKNYRGDELLAEERNSLIDFCGYETMAR